MIDFRPMKKAGPLHNGYERGKGSIVHAVPPDHSYRGPALCGQRPAIQWSDCEGCEVTCPRCKSAMTRQSDLFERPPRRKRRRMMHVCDAGSGMVKFSCVYCGYASDWLPAGKLSVDKRGRPCPRCNGSRTDGGAA